MVRGPGGISYQLGNLEQKRWMEDDQIEAIFLQLALFEVRLQLMAEAPPVSGSRPERSQPRGKGKEARKRLMGGLRMYQGSGTFGDQGGPPLNIYIYTRTGGERAWWWWPLQIDRFLFF